MNKACSICNAFLLPVVPEYSNSPNAEFLRIDNQESFLSNATFVKTDAAWCRQKLRAFACTKQRLEEIKQHENQTVKRSICVPIPAMASFICTEISESVLPVSSIFFAPLLISFMLVSIADAESCKLRISPST